MKTLFMLLITGVIYASLITAPTAAQVVSNISYPVPSNDSYSPTEAVKKALDNRIDPIDKNALKEMKANLKAAKANLKMNTDFNKNFKTAVDVKWNNEPNAIIATFKKEDKSTKVVYDKKGNRAFSIVTYFKEELLPNDIRSLVESSYNDFDITLIQEINQDGILVYVVHLESNRNIKQILVCNGEITPYNDFKKSK